MKVLPIRMPYFFIMLLAMVIRAYHYRHVLMSDEANNMLTIKALIEGDGVRDYFFKHPPLFTVLSAAISYPFGDNYLIVQGVSIVFSVLSMVPFYLIVRRLFDERTALLSGLFLAVMPLNMFYSTWVKQDPMLLFFFTWSLYLYMTERPFASGVLFGVSMLTKEFAFFLIPIVIGMEVLHARKGAVKRLLIWFIGGIAISGWWYPVYGMASFGTISDAAYGGNLFEFAWHHPWHYYIRNIPGDLSWPLIPFFIAGLVCLVYHPSPLRLRSGQALSSTHPGINPHERRGERYTLLPLLWVLTFYLPLSLMTVKAPWYTYLASPALAIITSAGFLKAWDAVKTGWLKAVVGALLILSVAVNISRFHAPVYYDSHAAKKERELPIFYEKEYLTEGREILKGGGRAALLEYSPTLQYYLGIPDKRRLYVGPGFPAMGMKELRDLAERENIGWFVIDTNSINYLSRNIDDLTSLWGKPRKVGSLLIFRTDIWNF